MGEGFGFKLPDRDTSKSIRSPTEEESETESLSNIKSLLRRIAPEERLFFYDLSDTIGTAQTTALREDDANYVRERVFDRLGRNAPKLNLINDGPGTWYVRHSHDGQNFSEEFPIYEGEAKSYLNVYEVRHRSPLVGMAYRVTEFELWKQKNVDFKAGRGYVRNQTLAVGNAVPAVAYTTSDLHNFNAALQRNATTGYIKNRDPLNTLFVWISNDGTEFGQSGAGIAVEYTTVDPNGAINIDLLSIHSVRVGADANNIDYEIFVG